MKINLCLLCKQKTKNPKFCSRSCSAKLTNVMYPRRKTKRRCVVCQKPVSSYKKARCDPHTLEYKEQKLAYINRTLGEYQDRLCVKGKHPSWLNVHIRRFARSWNKDLLKLPCSNCNYDKHVEICHIKPIRSFTKSATIGEVNNRKNLIQLCPNCHWEFDSKILTLKKILKH